VFIGTARLARDRGAYGCAEHTLRRGLPSGGAARAALAERRRTGYDSGHGDCGAPAARDSFRPPLRPPRKVTESGSMRLIVLDNEAMIAEVVCHDAHAFIGAGPTCLIRLPDPRVAAQQALLHQDNQGQWSIEQLHAENELRVNGVPVAPRAPLRHGDEIQIHNFLIRAYLAEEEIERPLPGATHSIASMTKFAQFALPPGAVVKKPDEPVSLKPAQLTRVAQVSARLSQCIVVEDLMNIVFAALFECFPVQRAWMGVRRVNYGSMEYVEGRLNTGQSADLPDIGDKLKPRVLDRSQFVMLPAASPEEPRSVLVGPLNGPDGALGMVYLDTEDLTRRFDLPDLDFFVGFLDHVAVQLDAVFKYIAQNRAKLMEGEVSVAHAIQSRLTPRKLPQWEELQFGAFREPGRERTGDIYDIVRLSNKMAAVLVAHTSAAGPLPSMLIAQSQAAFRVAAMHLDAPHVFLRSLNFLLHDGQDDHPLDCFMGAIEPTTGEMKFSMAGNIGAYIIGARGEERRLTAPEPLPPAGVRKTVAYPLLTEQLDSGESLVLFTPGVTSARNRHGEVFGQERFINILCDGFGQLASSMLKEMLSDLQHFTEAGMQPEDITVLLAHRL
jgi:sigma-B regulation protein RsbU (phosphoserine phosphatase)